MTNKKFTFLGQDWDVIMAVFSNILSWIVRVFCPGLLPKLLPKIPEEHDQNLNGCPNASQTKCIAIGRPGGKEQLRIITLKPGFVTAGVSRYYLSNQSIYLFIITHIFFFLKYNVGKSFVDVSKGIPKNTVVVRVVAFSINFADCAIRWGLYESANTFVGWYVFCFFFCFLKEKKIGLLFILFFFPSFFYYY